VNGDQGTLRILTNTGSGRRDARD